MTKGQAPATIRVKVVASGGILRRWTLPILPHSLTGPGRSSTLRRSRRVRNGIGKGDRPPALPPPSSFGNELSSDAPRVQTAPREPAISVLTSDSRTSYAQRAMPSADVEVYRGLREAFDSLALRWYLFGAQAAILHGAVRLTEDIDVTVDAGELPTTALVSALVEAGFALRVGDTDGFVDQTRVLPCWHAATRIPVDVVLAGPGLEEAFLDRSVVVSIETERVPVACAEVSS